MQALQLIALVCALGAQGVAQAAPVPTFLPLARPAEHAQAKSGPLPATTAAVAPERHALRATLGADGRVHVDCLMEPNPAARDRVSPAAVPRAPEPR